MTPETRARMEQSLPAGYEIVKDREYPGELGCSRYSPVFGEWVNPCGNYRFSDYEWKRGYRYARKITPKWTTTPPTEPEMYWWRKTAKDKPEPVNITKGVQGLVARRIFSCVYQPASQMKGEWWPVPIEPPKEGE